MIMQRQCKPRMLAMRLVLAAALLALAAPGCAKRDMWPLQQGNEWVYHEHFQFGVAPTGEVRYKVASVTERAGDTIAVIEVFRNDSEESVQQIELTKTKDGIYESSRTLLIYVDDYQEVKITFKPMNDKPPYLVTPKPKQGQTWNFKYQAEDLTFGASTVFSGQTIVEGTETISPAAGQFKALRIVSRAHEEDNIGFENRFYWFKPGVGPVKIEVQHMTENSVLMLKRAKIGKKKIGKW
jgi:nitrogen fixation protein FixH